MERSSKSSKNKKDKIRKKRTKISNNSTSIIIDSMHRHIESRNIIDGDNYYLDIDPLQINASDSDCEVIVSHPNHSYEINDNIILQGVKSDSVLLDNGITFIGNSSYARINHSNHGIDFSTENDMYIFIGNFAGISNGNTTFNNIPNNEINTLHKIYSVKNSTEIYSGDYYYINMGSIISNFSSTYNLTAIKITFKDINGIELNYLNANYPLDVGHRQGYHTLIDVTDDTYTFTINTSSNISLFNVGGDRIYTAKVSGFIQGYPHNNHYKIPLRKTFQNDEMTVYMRLTSESGTALLSL